MLFIFKSINTMPKSMATVALTSLVSGYGAPSFSTYIAETYPKIVITSDSGSLTNLSSLIIGIAVPAIIVAAPIMFPIIIKRLALMGDRK